MSEVELFDDVGRGVLDNDFFALPRIVAAILGLSGGCGVAESIHLVKNLADHGRSINSEMKKGSVENDGLDPFVRSKLYSKI